MTIIEEMKIQIFPIPARFILWNEEKGYVPQTETGKTGIFTPQFILPAYKKDQKINRYNTDHIVISCVPFMERGVAKWKIETM